MTADQGRLNDTDALIVLNVGKGAAAYLTRRLGVDALRILEDALNQHAETYACQITHIWQGRPETIIQFLLPPLRTRLRAIKCQTDGNCGHAYYFVVAAEKITKAETYEAWAHPIEAPVIILRPNEREITRCGNCTRPLPANCDKCPHCLHQYKDDTAIVQLDTQPTAVRVQFDLDTLAPKDDEDTQPPQQPTPLTFGLAFHPDSQERLSRIPPEERAELDSKIARTLKGYTYQKMRLRSGAHIVIANPSQQSETTTGAIMELDQLLRELEIGYVLDTYELRKAQAKADRWSKAKTR